MRKFRSRSGPILGASRERFDPNLLTALLLCSDVSFITPLSPQNSLRSLSDVEKMSTNVDDEFVVGFRGETCSTDASEQISRSAMRRTLDAVFRAEEDY